MPQWLEYVHITKRFLQEGIVKYWAIDAQLVRMMIFVMENQTWQVLLQGTNISYLELVCSMNCPEMLRS